MAFFRRRRRRFFYRRTYRGRGSRRVNRATRAFVRRVVNVNFELKWFSQSLFSATASTVGWQYGSALAGLTQGFTQQTRIGSRVLCKRIEFTVFVSPITAAIGLNGSLCRMICYHNKQAGGTLVTSQILFDLDVLNTFRNLTQSNRVQVLRDVQMPMIHTGNNGTVTTSVGPCMRFFWRIPVNKVIVYQGNAGTISDIVTDDYGFGFVSDDAGCCAVSAVSKMIFTDS